MRLNSPKVTLLVFLLSVSIFNGSCILPGPPGFSGGIRIYAFLGVANSNSVSLPPLGGVPNRGRVLQQFPSGRGTAPSFMGATDAFGISDYPNAITNAQWSIGIGPSLTPPCADNAFVEFVPTPGAELFYYCHP